MDNETAMKLAYQLTILTQALIQIEGLKADNLQHLEANLPHTKADFDNIIDELGISHNAFLLSWR